MDTQNKRIHTLLADFIPILLIFCFVTLPKETILFSKTILGKLVAISIILYYTELKLVYGIFVCAVILFYYQTDLVENILNEDWRRDDFSAAWNKNIVLYPEPFSEFSSPATVDDVSNKMTEGALPFDYTSTEPFSYIPYVSYGAQNEDVLRGKDKKEELKAVFRKQYCSNGKPQWKKQDVRPDMIEHVFREIKMGDKKCNPCDQTCDFNIIEERLGTEEKLVRPKSSKEEHDWLSGIQHTLENIAELPFTWAEHWSELQYSLFA